eukprot:2453989-Alexandrium_andersonii.AAC.1
MGCGRAPASFPGPGPSHHPGGQLQGHHRRRAGGLCHSYPHPGSSQEAQAARVQAHHGDRLEAGPRA